jgi:hypothetical protein
MITLPARGTDEGAETRVLLAECRGPAFQGFNMAEATTCFQLMDLVLWNRVSNPKPFLAKASTLVAVITAHNQFQGFESYPNYSAAIVQNIQQLVDIANNSKDKRSTVFSDFIGTAMRIAGAATIADPSPGTLTAWRTGGSGSPGPGFTFYKTVLGNSFYYMP